MDNISTNDLPTVTTLTESDTAIVNSSGVSRKINLSNLFTKVSLSNLTTSAKNISGAINENKSNINLQNTNLSALKSLINMKTWVSKGEDLLALPKGIHAMGTNPNDQAKQGVPSGFSPYGSYVVFTGIAYTILLYVSVFGEIAAYNTHIGKWNV